MKIEFYRHNLNDDDKKEVQKILESLFLTTGDSVVEFENKFAKYTENQHALGITSCTEGLFLGLKYLGIKDGDEVITTPMSFVSTANSIEYCNAKPVFVDAEKTTGNIDIDKIEAVIAPNTKAVIPVHLYGQMCDMKRLKEIAIKNNLKIIEDSAHCIEGSRDDVRPGQLGDIACYSFYATKNITCGEGGAITCNNQDAHDWIKKARLHGISKSAADRYTKRYEHYDMDFLGFKANMTNIDAALLIHQIDRIEELLSAKENIAKRYDDGFSNNLFISIPNVLPNSKHARHIYTIWVNPQKRDEYMHQLQDVGIGVAVNFRPIHLMKYYREKYGYKPGDFPVAEKIGNSTITIPLYSGLKDEEVDYIINSINKIIIQ
ncbi:DegT/DnrJ/EryC1/StrS family aminotransferase [Patescibacteria group bacterium]|nr:DegT/DnrJ/EryC1/StrS family aminotransferase [Patescibacteria group bacterium]MBU4162270.1 DegT/DnrJ/EryC1/StrS family aminotransferase [Patescibacteria group bacterium]